MKYVTLEDETWFGIYIDHSSSNMIKNSLISNAIDGDGVYLFESTGNKLDSIIVKNNYDGVHSAGSNDNELYNITAISNRDGIFLDNSHGNTILNFIIDDNSIIGIEIIDDSSINLIYNNYLRNSVNALIQTSGIN